MLKNLDPLLGPELLAVLRGMGHGDDIALVDANFPAAALARRLVRLDGVDLPRALASVLSVLPLDDFVPEPAWRMQVVGGGEPDLPIFAEVARALADGAGKETRLGTLERFAFYARAREAYAIVATGERRLYGCVLLRKGVLRPPG